MWRPLLWLAFVALAGCQTQPPPGVENSLPNATESGDQQPEPQKVERLPDEQTRLLAGDQGDIVLAHGRVITAAGNACPYAFVTLDQDSDGVPRRCFVSQCDAQGKFTIRGNVVTKSSNMIWAATEQGQLGMVWNSDQEVTIKLLGGTTVLYVLTSHGQPVVNARVTPYQCSIDDISEVVPPNLRKYLERTTDQNGKVEFASTLGYYDLGFYVRAYGQASFMRDGYASADRNLFLLDDIQKPNPDVEKRLREKMSLELGDRPLNFGSPAQLPSYLQATGQVPASDLPR